MSEPNSKCFERNPRVLCVFFVPSPLFLNDPCVAKADDGALRCDTWIGINSAIVLVLFF